MKKSLLRHSTKPSPRAGLTLTEVLMATMLMGIGVVTLASLFPVSIYESIKATQLTNSTILRYNVEELLKVYTPLVLDDTNIPKDSFAIVDPLGWHLVDSSFQSQFGHGSSAITFPNRKPWPHIHPSLAWNQQKAQQIMLGDSWINFTEAVPTNVSSTSITLPSNVDLSDVSTSNLAPSRVVLFHENGRQSFTAKIANVTGSTLNTSIAIPSDYQSKFTKARIQTYELRYSWMLTVRKNATGLCNIDVVTFFRRSYADRDEQAYLAPSGNVFNTGNDKAVIQYTADTKPPLKRGGYVFDAENGYWYNVVDVKDDPSNMKATLTFDRVAAATSQVAILPSGVVDVYPIESIQP